MVPKTTRVGQRYTTIHLTPPSARARQVSAALVVLLVALTSIAALLHRGETPRPVQESQPLVMRQVIYIVATPTPQLPTPEPAVVAAPTVEPVVIYQTVEVPVEVPVYVVGNASQAEVPAEEWHPPMVLQNACASWHPPMAPIEGC